MRRLVIVAFGTLLALQAGCVTDDLSPESPPPEKPVDSAAVADNEKIQEAYEHMRDAVLKRDVPTVFAHLSSALQRQLKWESFQQDYPKIEPYWLDFFRDAKLITVSHEADTGDVWLKYRDGTKILGMLREGSEWRISRLVQLPTGS